MSSSNSFIVSDVDSLGPVVDHVLKVSLSGPKLFLMYGDLGAGKTTLVKQIVAALGSEDATSSPTYSLVNEYHIPKGKLYHIDLYRINDTDEAVDMGIEDYILSESYCFVEWPQVILPLVEEYIKVEIKMDEENVRTINISHQTE